jgi:hypothetical protein
MAKPQSIDDLFPIGTPPDAGPSPAEIEAASKPAFFPKAPAATEQAPQASSLDTMFPTGGPPEPTGGDIAGTIAKGTAAGALRDAPVVAGAMSGFKLGMPLAAKAAPFIGGFAAGIPLVTTAVGGFLGYQAGQAAESVVPGETDPRLVPYREGGKTFGSTIATAPAAFFLPTAGPTAGRVAKFVSGIGETARRSPGVFMATEGLTAASMGLAGGAAEAYRPGQEGVRFGAEMGAALLTPTKLLLSGVDLAKTGLSAVRGAAGGRSAATERKAVNVLLDALNKSGEDPEALIKALRTQLPGSVPTPTAGQKTGSQALMDLEASLGNHRAEFGGETAKQGRIAALAYQSLIEKLQELGDPQALRVVAELQQKRFDNVIETRLSLADANAAAKIARITKDTPEARQQIGQLVKNETELALAEARDVEGQLWSSALKDLTKPVSTMQVSKVPMEGIEAQRIYDRTGKWPQITINQPIKKAPTLTPSATTESFLARASEMGPALYDEIPPQVRKIMETFGVDQAAVAKFRNGKLTDAYLDTGQVPQGFSPKVKEQPVQDLVNYRSTLLKMARDAAGAGDSNKANFFSSMADGMMRDLDTLQDPMYDQARQFSRSLNDVFTRTYAGTVGAVSKTGKERVSPETLVLNAFGGNADQTAQRMKEIEDAVGFMRTQYRDVVKQFGKDSPQAQQLLPLARAAATNVASVRDAHNRVLRLAAADAIEVVPGREPNTFVQKVNFGKLTRFAQQNAPMLEKMGIMGDLRDAAQASNLLTQVANENSALSKAAKNQSTFAKMLTAESPTVVIAESLNGRFPVKSINGLVDLAKKGGPEALDGLKASLFDYAYAKAKGYSQANKIESPFSPGAYEAALFEPLGRNQPSLVNIMRSNGLMTLQEMSNLKKLVTPMVRIETAMKNNIPYEDVIQGADAVTDLALRVTGAQIGTAAAPGGPGSLIAASAGSKAVRQIFDALPNATVRTILENAVKDPQAMALLLQKGRTEKEQMDIANKLINYVGSLGVSVGKSAVTPSLNYLSAQEERPAASAQTSPFTAQGQAARQLRQLPQAPTTRGVPGFNPKPGAQAAPAPGGAPTNANARSMMQSLFPFDSVSNLAAQQSQQQPPAPG